MLQLLDGCCRDETLGRGKGRVRDRVRWRTGCSGDDGTTARGGAQRGGGRSTTGLMLGRSQDMIEARNGSWMAGRGRWRGMAHERPNVIAGAGSDASVGRPMRLECRRRSCVQTEASVWMSW